jgi:predicted negative regulator of RcsB-dependent stress response
MVDENLTDEQQADLIRQWFRENGIFALGGLGLGLAALVGWDQWQSYDIQHAEEASGIYEELVGKIKANNLDEANSLLAELVSDYSGSPYVDQARLRLTKLSLDRSAFDVAASYLESVIAESSNDEILHIARIRLARIRVQQEQYEAALAVLEPVNTDSAFYAQVNNVRGDIYVVMNRTDEALAAYDAALTDTRQPPSIDRAFVQAKRDSLDVENSAIQIETGIDTSGGTDDASTATE